jgi:hypothetical protein
MRAMKLGWVLLLGVVACAPPRTPPSTPAVTMVPPATLRDALAFLATDRALDNRGHTFDLFMGACDAGDRTGCEAVVGSLRIVSHTRQTMYARASRKLWEICGRGDFFSCRVASTHEVFPLKGASLHQACEHGVGGACYELARNPAYNQALMIKACNLGEVHACAELALKDPKWHEAGRQILIRGCDAGFEQDCDPLLAELEFGTEANTAMYDKLNAAAKVRCLRGVAEACDESRGSDADAIASRRMYCMLDPFGCHDYGVELSTGNTPHDLIAARKAFEASCEWSEEHETRARDCGIAAKLYDQDLDGARADPSRAAVLAERACQLGQADACNPK